MKDLTTEEIDELKKEVETARKEKKEREEQNPYKYYPSTYGWICPVCGKGNAPFSLACPCKDVKYYWTVT